MSDTQSPLWTENKRMRAVIAQQREELAAKERRIAELEGALAAVPMEALRWIDRSYTEGFWDEEKGPSAYAALHAWAAARREEGGDSAYAKARIREALGGQEGGL